MRKEGIKYLFVIGAGASKDFDKSFPTGEELIEKLGGKNKSSISISKSLFTGVHGSGDYKYVEQSLNNIFTHQDLMRDFYNFDLYDVKNLITIHPRYGNNNHYYYLLEYYRGNYKAYFTLIDKNSDIPIKFLLSELLQKDNPKSIDKYIGEDMIHGIKNYIPKLIDFEYCKYRVWSLQDAS